ncbi:hypothetical protein CGK14_23125 [Vibrio parahaemolyticus]|uniref:hypothetical protein n=1 Tax=Vibrio parahaemolyticus TaxID=670 RepID=UPI00112291D3|nr:hypothetical protein [Vibrio parahaemolyticus]TOB01106.1 hypothetical protein CGK14_23125 [Vibrio parahaemolyticus]
MKKIIVGLLVASSIFASNVMANIIGSWVFTHPTIAQTQSYHNGGTANYFTDNGVLVFVLSRPNCPSTAPSQQAVVTGEVNKREMNFNRFCLENKMIYAPSDASFVISEFMDKERVQLDIIGKSFEFGTTGFIKVVLNKDEISKLNAQ